VYFKSSNNPCGPNDPSNRSPAGENALDVDPVNAFIVNIHNPTALVRCSGCRDKCTQHPRINTAQCPPPPFQPCGQSYPVGCSGWSAAQLSCFVAGVTAAATSSQSGNQFCASAPLPPPQPQGIAESRYVADTSVSRRPHDLQCRQASDEDHMVTRQSSHRYQHIYCALRLKHPQPSRKRVDPRISP
jgi:hypothetical protein